LSARQLKSWSSRPIVGDRGTGLAGFNFLINPTVAAQL
jgi:hypothetical protein